MILLLVGPSYLFVRLRFIFLFSFSANFFVKTFRAMVELRFSFYVWPIEKTSSLIIINIPFRFVLVKHVMIMPTSKIKFDFHELATLTSYFFFIHIKCVHAIFFRR